MHVWIQADVPRILSTGTWGDKDSVRRQVLDALTVHIPLIKWDYNRGGQVVLYYLNRYVHPTSHALTLKCRGLHCR